MKDQRISGGRRELIICQIGVEIPKTPDAFARPGDFHWPHQRYGLQSSSTSPINRLKHLRGCRPETDIGSFSHPIIQVLKFATPTVVVLRKASKVRQP